MNRITNTKWLCNSRQKPPSLYLLKHSWQVDIKRPTKADRLLHYSHLHMKMNCLAENTSTHFWGRDSVWHREYYPAVVTLSFNVAEGGCGCDGNPHEIK